MIEHVRRRTLLCRSLQEVVVATCDKAIVDAVTASGGRAVMTSDRHERCTDRIAEAAKNMDADIIVNVQGDEPLILPTMIDEVIGPLLKDIALPCSNLMTPIVDDREFKDPNAVKVVVNAANDLLYASREPIPSRQKAGTDDYPKWKQLGIIAFRKDFLQKFALLPATPLEKIESVDMMRAIEHGYKVRMVPTTGCMIGVDIPEDVARTEAILKNDPFFKDYR